MAKKLLEESTVRRFMKIAGLQPLSENFITNLEEEAAEEAEDQEEVVEGMYEQEPGMETGDMQEPEAEMDMQEPEAEMDMQEPEAEEEGGEEEVELEPEMGSDDKIELLQKLAQALGVDVEVEGEEEAGEEEAGEEEVGEEEAGEEEVGEEEAGEEMMEETARIQKESKEAFKKRLVEEVAKRVATRLKQLK